jgi:DNA-binding NarL/FixJ family response regulator
MLKLIVADDHDVVRQSLVQCLVEEFSPVQVEEAADATALIALEENGDWDLIISDMAMPGGGGMEALRVIREKSSDVPFIVISTYPAEQYESRVIKAGAQAYISKDELPHALINAVKKVVRPH